MRIRARATLLALALAFLAVDPPSDAAAQAAAPTATGPQHLWSTYATVAIANHARRVGAQEAKEKRRTCQGDANGDGKNDVGVVYTLEGGKGPEGTTQHLMLLVWSPQGAGASAPRDVGAGGTRVIESCALTPGVVTMQTSAGELRVGFEKGAFVDLPAAAPSGS